MEERKVALIGMGNIMFHDEGLGTYLAHYLEANYEIPDNLVIVDGGLLGFSLMTYYQEYDKIIIVGTNSKEGKPGSISRYTGEEMMAMGNTRKTANEVELTMMLEVCSFHEAMGEVELLTMIPEDIVDVCNGLTDTVLKRMPNLLDKTLQELADEGIVLKPKRKAVSFAAVIETCANPMTQRMV
jgi:hydrogenase maturation protease